MKRWSSKRSPPCLRASEACGRAKEDRRSVGGYLDDGGDGRIRWWKLKYAIHRLLATSIADSADNR
jgi:hypothetical protein